MHTHDNNNEDCNNAHGHNYNNKLNIPNFNLIKIDLHCDLVKWARYCSWHNKDMTWKRKSLHTASREIGMNPMSHFCIYLLDAHMVLTSEDARHGAGACTSLY